MISASWECCGLGENLLPAQSFVKEAPFERNLIAGFHTTRPVSRCQLMRHNGWDTNKNQLKKIWGFWRARHCQRFWAILLKPKISSTLSLPWDYWIMIVMAPMFLVEGSRHRNGEMGPPSFFGSGKMSTYFQKSPVVQVGEWQSLDPDDSRCLLHSCEQSSANRMKIGTDNLEDVLPIEHNIFPSSYMYVSWHGMQEKKVICPPPPPFCSSTS